MAKLVYVLLTITALLLHEGDAIKCWSCNSNGMGGSGCADPFGGSTDISDDLKRFSKDCDQLPRLFNLLPGATHFIPAKNVTNDSGLVIVCYKLTGLNLGAPYVIRGCGAGLPDVTETSCMYAEPENQTGGRIITCGACLGDFCNGADDVAEPVKQPGEHIQTCEDCQSYFCSGAADVGSDAMLFIVALLLLFSKTTSEYL